MASGKKILLLVAVVVALMAAAGATAIYLLLRSGITRPIDNKFGDQHLKTTVALVELHKTRFGQYPEQLSDLRFTGDWDAIALHRTEYCTNSDQTAYYVEEAVIAQGPTYCVSHVPRAQDGHCLDWHVASPLNRFGEVD